MPKSVQSPPSVRPTSSSFLTPARCGAIAASVSAGVAVTVKLFPDAVAVRGFYTVRGQDQIVRFQQSDAKTRQSPGSAKIAAQ